MDPPPDDLRRSALWRQWRKSAQMEGYLHLLATSTSSITFSNHGGIEHVSVQVSQEPYLLIKLQFLSTGHDMSPVHSETRADVNRRARRDSHCPGHGPPFIMRFDAAHVPLVTCYCKQYAER